MGVDIKTYTITALKFGPNEISDQFVLVFLPDLMTKEELPAPGQLFSIDAIRPLQDEVPTGGRNVPPFGIHQKLHASRVNEEWSVGFLMM